MEKTNFLAYFSGTIDGTFTSIVDAYFNAVDLRGHSEKLFVATNEGNMQALNSCLRKDCGLSLHDVSIVTKAPECETLVCSWRALPMSSMLGLHIGRTSDNVLMLDSSAPFVHMHNISRWLDHVPRNSLSLCNPATSAVVGESIKTIEHYHQFSERRLNHINKQAGTRVDMAAYCDNRGKRTYAPHAMCLCYVRHWVYNSGSYENIGKSIFECLLRGGSVEYRPDLKTQDDGLTYYMKKCGVDDSMKQKMTPMSVDLRWALPTGADEISKIMTTSTKG